MTSEEFQTKAHEFSDYPVPVNYDTFGGISRTNVMDYTYPAMGLAEEAGEVVGKFAKAVRDDGGRMTEERKVTVKKELGDVMWFVAELCTLLGFTLEEVMDGNIEKLESRRKRGCIHGSGDER